MLHLTFAPQAKILVKILNEILKELWKDPFYSPLIVVPNLVVERWLKEVMVSEWGTILEPQISNLENVLWKALNPPSNIRLLDKNKLQQIIIALLKKEFLMEEFFTPLLDYLGDEKDPSSYKKRIQIAGELAHFFLEYEYHRPSVWENNPNCKGRWKVYGVEKTWLTEGMYFSKKVKKELIDSVVKQELWQRELYSMIFGRDGILGKKIWNNSIEQEEICYLTLPQLYLYKHDLHLQNGEEIFTEKDPLVIFLLNKISHFHRNMLLEMSEKREIYVFLVNVCSEFWEDVDTSRGKSKLRKWNNLLLKDTPIKKMSTEEFEMEELPSIQSDTENKLLALWGKSGRENITLWCQAVEYDFEYIQPEENKEEISTILKNIQMSILHRQKVKTSNIPLSDDSITILCAPEIGREVETLRENIFEILYKDPTLRIEDISVYVTNIEKYSPFIHKVFGAYEPEEDGYIPYSIIGGNLGESLFVRAIKDFLSICGGEFTRGRVFSFLSNELVCKARNLTPDEVEIWKEWALETGFWRGFDALHRREMGDSEEIATDEHTFIFGISRLLLGYFAVYPVPLNLKLPLIEGEKIYPLPYSDFNTSDKDLIEKYFTTIEELANSSRKFVNICKEKVLIEIIEEFISLCNKWIETSSLQEENIKDSFIESLLNIKLQEEIGKCKNLSFDYLKELILACLPDELSTSSIKLTGNLVFYPLRAGYILPHKIIFVLGLDEDSFPGYNPESQLNLLYSKRIIGDPDEISDNRHSFLELLCSAEKKLFLSWVGRDILKDKIISPSSILLELTEATGIKLPTPTIKDSSVIPLSPYESISFSDTIPCWNPANAKIAFILQNTKESMSSEEKIFFNNKNEEKNNYYEIDVEDIAIFLKNPFEYHLRRTLLLKGEEIEIIFNSDEPLTSDYSYMLRKFIFSSLLQLPLLKDNYEEIAKEIVKNVYKKWCAAGNAPEGFFGKLELHQLNEWSQKILQNIISISNTFSDYKILNKDKEEEYFSYNFTYNNKEYKIKMEFPFILFSENPSLKKAMLLKLSSFNNNEEWLWSKNLELWLSSLFLSTKEINKIENSLFSYKNGEMLSTEWKRPTNFDNKRFHNWLDEIISAMINKNECFFAPAIWFEKILENLKKYNREPVFNKEFIYNFKDLAYEELEDNNKFPLYNSLGNFTKMIDISLPQDDIISNIFKRLSPILKGEFIC